MHVDGRLGLLAGKLPRSAVAVGSGLTSLPCAGGVAPGSTSEDVVRGRVAAETTGELSLFTALSVAGRTCGAGPVPRAAASGSSTSASGNAVSAVSVLPVASAVPSDVVTGGAPVSGRTRTGAPGPSRVSSTAARTGRPAPSGATGGPSTTAPSVPAASSSPAASRVPSPGGGTSETTMVSGGTGAAVGLPERAGPAVTSLGPVGPLMSRAPLPSGWSSVAAYEPLVITFGGAVVISAAGAGTLSSEPVEPLA